MSEQILVPMTRNDRAEDLIPYVEKVARPGMKVVFMVPYPVEGLCWSNEEFGRRAIEAGKRLARYYTWEANLQKARERIEPASKILPAKGVEVTVNLYAGSLRNAVHDYAAKGDIHLILTRAGIAQRIAGFLNGRNSLSDLLKRPALSPVLLIHPGMAA